MPIRLLSFHIFSSLENIFFYLSFRPIFRSYKPLDENFGDSVLPEVEVPEVRDKVKDELEHEHEALKMENLVKTDQVFGEQQPPYLWQTAGNKRYFCM